MDKHRKVAVSIRMPASDVTRVKQLATRLGTRESEIVRYAVKVLLSRLAPLADPAATGRGLVPAFVESGADFIRFFDLDTARLESIINEGVDDGERVERDDIALIALTSAPQPYAELRLSQMNADTGQSGRHALPSHSLREYLYEKYIYRGAGSDERTEQRAALTLSGGV